MKVEQFDKEQLTKNIEELRIENLRLWGIISDIIRDSHIVKSPFKNNYKVYVENVVLTIAEGDDFYKMTNSLYNERKNIDED